MKSTSCSFLHPPVTSSLLGPYILLNTLFSNTYLYFGETMFYTLKSKYSYKLGFLLSNACIVYEKVLSWCEVSLW
jgi:hypothetical protein